MYIRINKMYIVRLPKSDVAVTELIPDIFVALSPTIFPFAFMLPETVSAPRVPTEVIFVCAAVVICVGPIRNIKNTD